MTMIANLGAMLTLFLGCLGLSFPQRICRLLGIIPNGPLGISELRATYGGFFLCLGTGCLVTQSEAAFQVTGVAWCGAALARLMSVVVDKSRSHENIAGFVIEATIGLMMLSVLITL
jgi:hypothetical protein